MISLRSRTPRSFRPTLNESAGQVLEPRFLLAGDATSIGMIRVDIAPTDDRGETLDAPHVFVEFDFMSDDTYTSTIEIGDEEDPAYYAVELVTVALEAEPQLRGDSNTTGFNTGLADITARQLKNVSQDNLTILRENYQKAFDNEMALQKQALDTVKLLRDLSPTGVTVKLPMIEFSSILAEKFREQAAKWLHVGQISAIEVSTKLALLHQLESERLNANLTLIIQEQNNRILNR